MIKVAVAGILGKMGKQCAFAIDENSDTVLSGAIDAFKIGEDSGKVIFGKENGLKIVRNISELSEKPDVIVDFTQPSCVFENVKGYISSGIKSVIGTTGMSKEQISELKEMSEKNGVGCFIAPNFTTGAVLMMMFAKTAAKYFNNAEIIEYHHNAKKDAPSGTAMKTAEFISSQGDDFMTGNVPDTELLKGSRGGLAKGNIKIHSVRMPGFTASQELIFGGEEQILTIRHDSFGRKCYMPGVLAAIRHVFDTNEFTYGLDNIL